jgi:putrescine aminotransferase
MSQKSNAEVVRDSQKALDMVAKATLTEEEKAWMVQKAVDGFRDHVNPGFLEYRKSVSNDYTAVEWKDFGCTFQDIHGKEYIDCLGGYGIYNCGHRHPKILKAVRDQLDRQALCSQELLDPLRAILATLVSDLTPGNLQYSFFTNSGTESVEGALKLARLATGRTSFIAATRAFHGKSMGSLTATSKAVFRKPYLPLVPGFHHVPFGDAGIIEKMLESCQFIGEDVAAVLLEPIQGEGGVIVPPDDYLPKVKSACERYGALLILDEVQTGMGRTGKMFCCEHWDVEPDILALGKAFGGGVMPAGAFVASARVWEKMTPNPFLHTTTFGGNPLACAAAIATINVLLEENLCERAAKMGDRLLKGLEEATAKYPSVALEVRGKGLIIGVEFTSDEKGYEVAKGLFDNGVLVAGTLVNAKTLRFEPPLTISTEQVDRVIGVMGEVLEKAGR